MKVKYKYNDGGRAESGRKGSTGDCVIRAISITLDMDYDKVYKDIFNLQKSYAKEKNNKVSRALTKQGCSPRNGVYPVITEMYLKSQGWVKIKGKRRIDDEYFRNKRVIVKFGKHLSSLIEGTLNDTYNCTMTKEFTNSYGETIPPKIRTSFHHYIKQD